MLDVFERARINGSDQNLPASLRAKPGANRNAKIVHYYLNYSAQEQTFSYPYAAGTELLTQTPVTTSQKITVKPWDLELIEEK